MGLIKKSSVFAMILVLVTALTACGGSTSTTGKATDSKKSTDTKTTSKTTATKSAAPAPIDLHGRTIAIGTWWDNAPKADTVLGKEMVDQQKKVEKEYNVKIKYVNAGWQTNNDKLVSSVLAGKPYVDIIRLTAAWALPDIAKGLLLPLNDFAPDMSQYPKFHPVLSFKGVKYNFTGNDDGGISGVFYNIDLFKKYGLTDPQTLVKEGKWNWANFEKLAKQATIDTNGDGKPDVYGLSGWDADVWSQIFASDNAQMVDSNGKVDLANPKSVESWEFYQKLLNDHVYAVQPKDNVGTFPTERQTFGKGNVAMTPYFEWGIGDMKNINYGFVPFPLGPHGTTYAADGGQDGWFIPKGVDNPKAVMQVYAALQDVKPVDTYPHQTAFENDFKRQSDIDNAKLVFQHQAYLPSGYYADFPLFGIMGDILLKNKDVTSVLKQYQPQAEAAVNKVLNPSASTSKKDTTKK